MLLSFEWLKEFIQIRKSASETAHLLTMSGLEVDSTREEAGETIFDIDLTPNRGDCLSVIGIARELGAVTGKKVRIPKFRMPSEDRRTYIRAGIDDRPLCRRYAGRVIKGVKVGDSPEWIKKRLEASGIRPINNIVDVTNYVLLEYGQPLHVFDYDKLSVKYIRAATPPHKLKFVTLDGVKRQITPDMLLIWDGENPVAIAGVMGGFESEVSESTTSIFLESACFDPTSVRRTSSRLGIRTESSFRFERGIDILNVDRALDRASFLISELAGGLLCKKVDILSRKYTPRLIKLKYESVANILGMKKLSNANIQDILTRVCPRVEDYDSYLHVEVPSYRNDLEREVDLIEEVARLYGYQKILSVPPDVRVEAEVDNKERKSIGLVKQLFSNRGYREVINYSFMNPESLDLLGLAKDDKRTKAVRILNPLRQEESLLRTSIIPSLLNNFVHNFNRGARNLRIFEIAKVFFQDKSERLSVENLKCAGLYYNEKMHQLWKSGMDDFYAIKGDADAMLTLLSGQNGIWKRSSEPFLHPGKSVDLMLGNKKAGYIGVVSPEVVSRLDIKIHKTDIVVFEFNMEKILSLSQQKKEYRRFSRYPHIQRDIALLVDADTSVQDIQHILEAYKSALIAEIKVFDYYRGKNIPEGKVSLAFTITYRSFDKTLSEEEIEEVHTSLLQHVIEKTGAELRA